uniref:DNA-directed DNA polymerase n=1 Tax=Parascaris equorum TaxID=6256 RepID=A0A914RYT7_PAREQ
MQLFLEQMPKPVCIIAHNGVKFDFRVLYAELDRHSLLNPNPIPEQVYFVDSYLMFMDLEKKHHDDLRLVTQFIDWSKWLLERRIQDRKCALTKEHLNREVGFYRRLNDGDWVFDGHVSMQYFREKGVFKLEQMYKEVRLSVVFTELLQLINGPFEAHFAQDDCEALLQVCMAYGQEFIDYVDAKATSFPYHVIANSTIALT